LRYRAEIDGLRAIAVIPVILFHAGFELFSGGFIGVDVFFVISGYLITTIVLEEMEEGSFSLIGFYERRARRILPALFFVIIVCIPFAWMWLTPSAMESFYKSLVAVAAFTSNFLFWNESGYFDAASQQKPLLHTWSLAIEEQFYILFPLFLMVTWKAGIRTISFVIIFLFLLSFSIGQWGAVYKPSAAFFLLVTRGWEILIGVLCAFYLLKFTTDKYVISCQLMSIVGLGLVVISIFTFDATTPIPGIYMLAPTIGTALLILFANGHGIVTRLLSNRVVVGMGLISYSAYLWHHPILSFAKTNHIGVTSEYRFVYFAVGLVVISVLTFKVVEKPFRRVKSFNIVTYIASWLFILGIGTIGMIRGDQLYAEDELHMDSLLSNVAAADFLEASQTTNFTGRPGTRLLIIGDSYAKDFYEGLKLHLGERFGKLDIIVLNIDRKCKNVLVGSDEVFSYIKPNDGYCLNQDNRIGTLEYDRLIGDANLIVVRSYWDLLPTLRMAETYDYVNRIAPNRVIFLGSTLLAEMEIKNRGDLVLNKKFGDPSTILPYTNATTKFSTVQLIEVAKQLMKGRNYISAQDYFCVSQSKCAIVSPEGFPYTDDGAHLTKFGEKMLVESLFGDSSFKEVWNQNIDVH
jgi:peptidoglycan/LPS O-acetylase OafA/YrhL